MDELQIMKMIKHVRNYLGSEVLSKALGFLSIPILTRLLSTADYGIINVYISYVSIFLIVLTLNSGASISRYYYENKDNFKDFVGTTIIFNIICFIITFFVILIFKEEISSLLSIDNKMLFFIYITVILRFVMYIYIQIMVPQKKSKEVSLIKVVTRYITFFVSVILIYNLNTDKYLGKIYAEVLVRILLSGYIIYLLKDYIELNVKLNFVKYTLIYSVPLMLYNLGSIILAQFDRIMINKILNSSDAGLYSLAYNIGMLLMILIVSFETALSPYYYDFFKSNDYDKLNSLVKRAFSLILIGALFLIYFSKEIIFILADEKFYSASNIIPIIVASYIFFSCFLFYSRYFHFTKKTYYLSINSVIAVFLNIFLNKYLLPIYGYEVAAYTTLISYFVMFILTYTIVKFKFKYKGLPIKLLVKPFILFLCAYIINYFLQFTNHNNYLIFFERLIILIAASIILFRSDIHKIINKWRM